MTCFSVWMLSCYGIVHVDPAESPPDKRGRYQGNSGLACTVRPSQWDCFAVGSTLALSAILESDPPPERVIVLFVASSRERHHGAPAQMAPLFLKKATEQFSYSSNLVVRITRPEVLCIQIALISSVCWQRLLFYWRGVFPYGRSRAISIPSR
jgi:hypothetical protein